MTFAAVYSQRHNFRDEQHMKQVFGFFCRNPIDTFIINCAAKLTFHPELTILPIIALLLLYICYVKFQDYQYQQQPINADIGAKMDNFLMNEDGKLFSKLLYDTDSNRYPPLRANPTMPISQLERSFLNDKKNIEKLYNQFNQAIQTLFFNPKQKIHLDNFSSGNPSFKKYIREKLVFWNETFKAAPDKQISFSDYHSNFKPLI